MRGRRKTVLLDALILTIMMRLKEGNNLCILFMTARKKNRFYFLPANEDHDTIGCYKNQEKARHVQAIGKHYNSFSVITYFHSYQK